MRIFENDDAAYLYWVGAHPNGFVLNVRAKPDPTYAVLHRATCGTIQSSNSASGAFTARNYRKVCAIGEPKLRDGALSRGLIAHDFSKRCGLCKP